MAWAFVAGSCVAVANVSLDLSTVLRVGQAHTIFNVQDFFGSPVVSGTYTAGTVNIPMAGIAAPRPIGRGSAGPVIGRLGRAVAGGLMHNPSSRNTSMAHRQRRRLATACLGP